MECLKLSNLILAGNSKLRYLKCLLYFARVCSFTTVLDFLQRLSICIPGNPVALVKTAHHRRRFPLDRILETEDEFCLSLSDHSSWSDHRQLECSELIKNSLNVSVMRNPHPVHRWFYLPEKFCCPYFRMTHAPESSCFKELFRPGVRPFSCTLLLSWCSPLPTFQSFGCLFVEDEGVSSVFPVCLQHIDLVHRVVISERKARRR